MPNLTRTTVERSGVTAKYWMQETNDVSYTARKDLKLRFSIASKGGGRTDIQISIAPEDVRSIILSAASAFPELATTFTEAAHKAVTGMLSASSTG